MARPGLTQHRKFLRLARLLGNAPLALGCLELMWEKCYQNGEPYLGDLIDVEAAAQWPGAPGELCKALCDAGGSDNAGFIEEDPARPGHYLCHDLYDHAPAYVAKRMEREAKRVERGETLTQLRQAAGRVGGQQAASKRVANGQQVNSKRVANDEQFARTPAPAPAPAPRKDSPAPGDPDATPVVLELPCVGSGPRTWPVTEARLAKWREAYPGVDVIQEARKMLLWLEDKPTNRKTFSGMGKFTLGWLGRAQDGGGGRASPARVSPLRPASSTPDSPFPKLARAGAP